MKPYTQLRLGVGFLKAIGDFSYLKILKKSEDAITFNLLAEKH